MARAQKVLLVDGYNVLNLWRPGLTGRQIDGARDQLVRLLHDYAGYSGQKVVVVFDAWQSDRKTRTEETQGRFSVVFTQRGETADHYIERLCDEMAERAALGGLEVRVATSDGLEQTIAMGRGAIRLSARELIAEIEQMRTAGYRAATPVAPRADRVMERLPEDVRQRLEKMRRGE